MDKGYSKVSWLGGKFLLSDYKKERKELLKKNGVHQKFFKSFLDKDNITKTYYDTSDFFFKTNGINININEVKGDPIAQLVVRYDSEKKRISFLKYMPDTYQLNIPANSNIANHHNFIQTAIADLIINGLRVDILEVLTTLQPVMIVKKKRNRWRFVGMKGLRVITSFDRCEYHSPLVHGSKQSFTIMELISENHPKDYQDAFNEYVKSIIRAQPKIIQIQHSDLFIGYDSLLKGYMAEPTKDQSNANEKDKEKEPIDKKSAKKKKRGKKK